ncbi:hypothetical protein LCGC14_1467160 [marine sediment metagenome]|uniref:Uncharacterized protein n=1 Tax=marine sediment metagenome TaxID=412755 RepID=A0A0F9JZE9_9ZZZZ
MVPGGGSPLLGNVGTPHKRNHFAAQLTHWYCVPTVESFVARHICMHSSGSGEGHKLKREGRRLISPSSDKESHKSDRDSCESRF